MLQPADVRDLYFVSRNDGSHQFSANLADHNRAVTQYQRHRGASLRARAPARSTARRPCPPSLPGATPSPAARVAGRSPEADDRPSLPIGPPRLAAALVGLVLFAAAHRQRAADRRRRHAADGARRGQPGRRRRLRPRRVPGGRGPVRAHGRRAPRVDLSRPLRGAGGAGVPRRAGRPSSSTRPAPRWPASGRRRCSPPPPPPSCSCSSDAAIPHVEAAWTAALFALGTSMWSTSQALWQHPAAVLFLCIALLFLSRAEQDAAWAGRAGLPLALAVAARHADVALVAVLAIGIAVRWPRRVPALAGLGARRSRRCSWRTSGGTSARRCAHGFSGSGARFSEPWGHGHLGLLVSPAKGLLVFTPLVVVAGGGAGVRVSGGASDGWRRRSGAAAVAHWILMGRWSEWHGGESWGPRMMTDALPLLFVFLPDGFNVMPRVAPALAAVSVAVQALGAFSYDYRWERLYWRGADGGRAPAALVGRRAQPDPVLPAAAGRHPRAARGQGRARLRARAPGRDRRAGGLAGRPSPRILRGSTAPRRRWRTSTSSAARGSRTGGRACAGGGTACSSASPRKRASAASSCASPGRGQGVLYVGEKTFWSEQPRWATYPVSGAVPAPPSLRLRDVGRPGRHRHHREVAGRDRPRVDGAGRPRRPGEPGAAALTTSGCRPT